MLVVSIGMQLIRSVKRMRMLTGNVSVRRQKRCSMAYKNQKAFFTLFRSSVVAHNAFITLLLFKRMVCVY